MMKKLAIPTTESVEIIDMNDIIRVEADRNYCTVFLYGRNPVKVTKSLSEIQKVLDKKYFFRIHKSNLVNLDYIRRILRIDSGYIEMADGSRIAVSRRKKNTFDKAMEKIAMQI